MIFFALDEDLKATCKDKDNNNIGYVNVNVREYIKLRPGDPDDLWPSIESFRTAYETFYTMYFKLAVTLFQIFAEYNENSTGKCLIEPEKFDAINQFLEEKSSVSVIHYFEHDESPKKKCLR